jgi:excisionase family DNA binding protein
MARPATLPAPQRGLLTERDAAAYLSVSYDLLLEMIRVGEIPLMRFTTPAGTEMKRVRVAVLDAWIRAHEDRPMLVGKRRSA